MAVLHKTTMNPTKVELLSAWLPAQPWYLGRSGAPRLARAGGFRLDDPAGEVGIEFAVATEQSADRAVTYLLPMTYRAHALAGGDDALIGTSQHGVLGKRWIYDGTNDLVLVTQLVALMQGHAEPQAQSVSNTADPTVTSHPVTAGHLTVTESSVAANGPLSTDLRILTAGADGDQGALLLRVVRTLEPDAEGQAAQPGVSATWLRPEGTAVRGMFATARYKAGAA